MLALLATRFPIGNFRGIGNIGLEGIYGTSQVQGISVFVRIVSRIVGVLTVAASIWFIFQFIQGAIAWIQSGGDKQAVENARKRITNSIIGLGIVVFAYAFIALISAFLGIDFINLQDLINGLVP
jgi:hypothetical protein